MTVQNYTAKTMLGLEAVLAEELSTLGATEIKILNRAVSFMATQEVLYKANYLCRTALHILMPIKEFDIESQDDLYNAVSEIAWEKIFQYDCTISISTVAFDSVYTHTKFASQRVKDAIVDRFRRLFNQRPSVDNIDPDICIDLYMKNNHCILSLDSSGPSLHKRGYRQFAADAPINEVLAAGIIALSGWDAKTTFFDPMCGSGTFLIEAAMKASNMPAAYYRPYFAFQRWNDYDANIWKRVKEEGLRNIHDPECEVYGSDISGKNLSLAERNIHQAKLHHDIQLKMGDFFEIDAPDDHGFIICNPPYGERLEMEDIQEFYKKIGDTLKKKYTNFEAWFISSDIDALKRIGLKTSRRLDLFNGQLECKLYRFELYEGTKKFKEPSDIEDTDC